MKRTRIAKTGDITPEGTITTVTTNECPDGSATITTTIMPDEPAPATRKRAARQGSGIRTLEMETAERTRTDLRDSDDVQTKTDALAEAGLSTSTDPAGGVPVRDCVIAVTGLPGSADAYGRALDLARVILRREPAHAVTILDKGGAVLFVIDAAHLTAVKAAKGTRAPSQPREVKTAPEGKRAEVVALCMRAEGASTKELVAATGWTGCPWAWTIGTNKNGTGLADRYGYGFTKAKVGEETRYFLTAAALEAS
jgi:hypothetical protein